MWLGSTRARAVPLGRAGSPRRVRPLLPRQADLDWSEAQREALRPRWALYQEQVASCRILAQYHLRGLQKDTATAVATWAAAETLPQLMESYAGVFDNAAGLDAWLRLEATAWADLAAFLCTVGAAFWSGSLWKCSLRQSCPGTHAVCSACLVPPSLVPRLTPRMLCRS